MMICARFARLNLVVVFLWCSCASYCSGQSGRDFAQRVCFIEHALNVFTSTGTNTEVLTIDALNAAYRDGIKDKRPLTAEQLGDVLKTGHHQANLLVKVLNADPYDRSKVAPLIHELVNASPYLGYAASSVMEAYVGSPRARILLNGGEVSINASNERVLDTGNLVRSLGTHVLAEALNNAAANAAFREAFDKYYVGILNVRTSSPQAKIINTENGSTSALADPASTTRQLIALFAQQSGLVSSAVFKQATGSFLSSATIGALQNGTSALTASRDGTQIEQTPSPEQQHIQLVYAETKAALEVGADLFFFAGTPLPASTINKGLQALNVAKDVALLFTPGVNVLLTSADMLGSIQSLLGGGSPDQAILQKLAELSKQITQLQSFIASGFSQINTKLNQILTTLTAEFSRIEASQERIEDGLATVENLIRKQSDDVAELNINLTQKLAALSAERRDLDIASCLNFSSVAPRLSMSAAQFNKCASAFEESADRDSRDPLHAIGSVEGDVSKADVLLDTDKAAGFEKDLSNPYANFNEVAHLNNLLLNPDGGSTWNALPNIEDWVTGALALDQLLRQSFNLRGNLHPESLLSNAIASGEEIQSSTSSISLARSQGDKTIFTLAAKLYEDAEDQVVANINKIEVAYRNKVPFSTDLDKLDLWNGPMQEETSVVPFPSINVIHTQYFSNPTQPIQNSRVGQLAVDNDLLLKAEPSVVRTAYALGILHPTISDVTPYASKEEGLVTDHWHIPACTALNFAFTIDGKLPNGSTMTLFQASTYGSAPPFGFSVDARTTDVLCGQAMPNPAAADSGNKGPFAQWLLANWQSSLEKLFDHQARTYVVSGWWDYAAIRFPLIVDQQNKLQGYSDAIYGVATAEGIVPLLDVTEQTLDFHRKAVELLTEADIDNANSELSRSLKALSNSKQLLRDEVMLGYSASAAQDSTLHEFLSNDDSFLDAKSLSAFIKDLYAAKSAARTAELDDWVRKAYLAQEDFEMKTMRTEPGGSFQALVSDKTLIGRMTNGHATADDVSQLAAYASQRAVQTPNTNNIHVLLNGRVSQNSRGLESLSELVSSQSASHPSGQRLPSVDSVLTLLDMDLALWQTP